MTIRGANFGEQDGIIEFTNSDGAMYRVQSVWPTQCAAMDEWTDTQVLLRVPPHDLWQQQLGFLRISSAEQLLRPWNVRMIPGAGGAQVNGAPYPTFTVTNGAPLPSICSMTPVMGPVGTAVYLAGEHFGDQAGRVDFNGVGTDTNDNDWDDESAVVVVPQGATTGPVRLWQQESGGLPELGSNPVTFTVGSCLEAANPDAACGAGVCCPNGTCKPNATQCEIVANVGAYQWTFKTGVTPPPPVVPRVVESCDARSPSPWDQHPDGDACTNAVVQAQFTMPMDVSAVGNSVLVYRCAGDACTEAVTGLQVVAPSATLVQVYPSSTWDPATTYEVRLCGAIDPGVCAPLRSTSGVALNGNEDGTGGADYRFRFRTGASRCAIDGVLVQPVTATATQPWPSGKNATDIGAALPITHPGLVHYAAMGTSRDGACQVLDPRGTEWTWSVQQPQEGTTYAAVDASGGRWVTAAEQCVAQSGFRNNRCSADTHTATARSFAETPPSQPAIIKAEAQVTSVQCGDGIVSGTEQCDGAASSACIVEANEQGTIALSGSAIREERGVHGRGSDGTLQTGDDSDLLASGMAVRQDDGALVLYQDAWWEYPLNMREAGSVRISLRTSNDPTTVPFADLFYANNEAGSRVLSRLYNEEGRFLGQINTLSNTLPRLSSGSSGPLQYHVTVYARGDDAAAVGAPIGDVWLNASNDVTTTELVLNALPAGTRALRFVWDNDAVVQFSPSYGSFDLNLVLHDIQATSSQQRACSASCSWEGAWGQCTEANITPAALTEPVVFETIDGSASLTVDFDEFRIVNRFPQSGCTSACTNAVVGAIVSADAGNTPLERISGILSGNTDSWTGDVGLFKCENAACLQGRMASVDSAIITVRNTGDACSSCVGVAPQLLINSGTLEARSYYRVVVRSTVRSAYDRPLSGLNYTTPGSTETDAYSWTFQAGEGICGVNRVAVSPNPVIMSAIGDIRSVSAAGYSRPDSCEPDGQPIVNTEQSWTWGIDDTAVAGFVAPTSTGWSSPAASGVGVLASESVAVQQCTARCVPAGSRRVSGICGNEVVETGEDCDKVRRCVGGDNNKELCTDDTACSGGTCGAAAFDAWCDATSCRNFGSLYPGSTAQCGNGDLEDGEECESDPASPGTFVACSSTTCLNLGSETSQCADAVADLGEECRDGNTRNGDGCSARCLNEGTPPGSVSSVRCGDGNVGAGEECDRGGAAGEAWNDARCDYQSCRWTGAESVGTGGTCGNSFPGDPGEQCDDGNNSSGDGCSGVCLLEGSSLRYAAPSICGDGVRGTGEAAACEETMTRSVDPLQYLQAVGTATPDGDGVQEAQVTAQVGTVSPGEAKVRLQCGYFDDASCTAGSGVGFNGCCSSRPTIEAWLPATQTNICRNARIAVRFNQLMDTGTPVGAAFERCTETTGCDIASTSTTLWESIGIPRFTTITEGIVKKTELDFVLAEALGANTAYRLRIIDATASDPGTAMRSTTGVRLGAPTSDADAAHVKLYTTRSTFCIPDRIIVTPASVLLQRGSDEVELRARAHDGSVLLNWTPEVPWTYAWESLDERIASLTLDAGDHTDVSVPSAAQEGNTFAKVVATFGEIDASTGAGAFIGKKLTAFASITAFLCENPWPAPVGDAWAAWPSSPDLNPYNLALSYCRDAGTRSVCRTPGAPEASSASSCVRDDECTDSGQHCLSALLDDLPAPDPATLVNGASAAGDLLLERLLLPRKVTDSIGVQYCSVSSTRCDGDFNCPTGEFCRAGDDAIGLRMYKNDNHLPARQWYRDQDFTDTTSPVVVDGYRAVQSGNSTYVNVANEAGNDVYTNIAVLSVNEGAVPETRAIYQQLLNRMSFNTNLDTQEERTCAADVGRCTVSGAVCAADGDCGANAGTCNTAQSVSCTSDFDCRVGDAGVNFGACAAPKQKLRRDTQRVEDLTVLATNIDAYESGRGATPDLAVGTFIPGFTMSKWPSWQQELGRILGFVLPMDPLNLFGGPCAITDNAAYEQATCWNQRTSVYTRPAGSSIYEYLRDSGTTTARIRAQFEYVRGSKQWVDADGAENLNDGIDTSTSAAESRSATGICGDGIVQASETCEPGITPSLTQACTVAGTTSGLQYKTCQTNCMWSTSYSECASQCGNGVVDGRCSPNSARVCRSNADCGAGDTCSISEVCDVGPAGGRVPAGHPNAGDVPGITSSTAYECTPQCFWRAITGSGLMRCSDGIVSAAYGEQCDYDGYTTPSRTTSSVSRQYACTSTTASEKRCGGTGMTCNNDGDCAALPTAQRACLAVTACRFAEGYCGDGVVQDGLLGKADHDEECDGDTRSCIAGGDTWNGSDFDGSTDVWVDGLGAGTTILNQYNTRTDWNGLSGASSLYTRYATGNSVWYIPLNMRGEGAVRVTLTTSNNNATVESISLAGFTNPDKFNPDGARGIGVYHRLYVAGGQGSVNVPDPAGTAAGSPQGSLTTEFFGPYWAKATIAATPQRTEFVVEGLPANTEYLVLVWNNDVNGTLPAPASTSFDSNFVLHRVELQSTQQAACNAPGAADACTWRSGATSTCIAPAVSCGNGVLEDALGEQCDDGGRGRCENELAKSCTRDSDCGDPVADFSARCNRDLDWCTAQCKTNACGDGALLAGSVCVGGTKAGQACTNNTQCTGGGTCRSEACDEGGANFTDAQLSAASCDRYDGRCNYCTAQQCTIVTKQGGFCGDGILQAPAGSGRCALPNPFSPFAWTCETQADCGTDLVCIPAANLPDAWKAVGSEVCDAGTVRTTMVSYPSGAPLVPINETCNSTCTGPQ
ncbi:MAG: hypothetical protein Q7T01_03530 [bacterium]|nr:hypothetical protein [bacterium]